MSDKKKEVLQEINFDSWDANGSPVTVTVDSLPLNYTDRYKHAN